MIERKETVTSNARKPDKNVTSNAKKNVTSNMSRLKKFLVTSNRKRITFFWPAEMIKDFEKEARRLGLTKQAASERAMRTWLKIRARK